MNTNILIETEQMVETLAHIEDLKAKCRAGMIIGNTGFGKTFLSKAIRNKYAKASHDVYMLTVSSTYTWDDVVDDLLEALGETVSVTSSKRSKQQKLMAIVAKIKLLKADGKKPIIIIDEGENLPVSMLQSIKTLYDALVKICAICLIGTDQIMDKILNKRQKNRVAIPQLWRRLKMGTITLAPIDRGKEFPKFFTALNIKDEALQSLCYKHCENYGELTDFLFPLIEDFNGRPTAKDAKKYFKLK
jgi:DNA transposition AAA+ family ATPase